MPLKRKRQDGAETAHHRFSVFAHAYSLFKFGDNGYYSSTKQTYWTFLRYVKVTHSLTRYATFYNHFVVECTFVVLLMNLIPIHTRMTVFAYNNSVLSLCRKVFEDVSLMPRWRAPAGRVLHRIQYTGVLLVDLYASMR